MSQPKRTPARIGIAERVNANGVTQYRGTAYDNRAGRHIRGPWTPNLAEARAWRVDALARLQAGALSADKGIPVPEAVERFVAGARSGAVVNRSGHRYKPSVVAGYERDLRDRVVFAFAGSRLDELRLPDIQRWADALATEGLAPSTVRNIVTALRALYAWALPRGLAEINPTRGLRLPTGEKARDKIVAPDQAAALLAALTPADRAAVGLAVYAGLRLGELLALSWDRVDLPGRALEVARSWDHNAVQFVAPKSQAGRRRVPIPEPLATILADYAVLSNQPASGLLFPGRIAGAPVHPTSLRQRVITHWARAGLEPLGFHEARHTYASFMIAAGVNIKALSTFMGHASITITLDRYGHLLPGAEGQAAELLNAYLAGPAA